MLNFIKISIIWYIILVLISILVIGALVFYIGSIYHFGKPMSKFFFGRIKSWVNHNIAVFEIFSLNHEVFLDYGTKETGGAFRLGEPISEKKTFYERYLSKKKTISTTSARVTTNLITPNSTYVVNGVTTVPLYDLHPPLHKDIITGLSELLARKVTNFDELKAKAAQYPDDVFFGNYTYKSFLDFYRAVSQKYSVNITAYDILNFIGNNFDKNYRETIDAKNFNVKAKSQTDSKYTKWAWAAIIIMALALGIKIVYVTIWGHTS